MKTTRKAISKRVRFEVFKRDRFKCVYCGAATPSVVLEVDHVIPVAEGGSNDISNLVTACKPCNQGKGARPLASSVPGIADRIAEEKELAAQMRALKRSPCVAAKSHSGRSHQPYSPLVEHETPRSPEAYGFSRRR